MFSMVLLNLLNKILPIQKLPLKYRRLKLGQRLIKDFYLKNNIMHYQKNNTMFISIPVTLGMSDQLFELHEIDTFPLYIGRIYYRKFSKTVSHSCTIFTTCHSQ